MHQNAKCKCKVSSTMGQQSYLHNLKHVSHDLWLSNLAGVVWQEIEIIMKCQMGMALGDEGGEWGVGVVCPVKMLNFWTPA